MRYHSDDDALGNASSNHPAASNDPMSVTCPPSRRRASHEFTPRAKAWFVLIVAAAASAWGIRMPRLAFATAAVIAIFACFWRRAQRPRSHVQAQPERDSPLASLLASSPSGETQHTPPSAQALAIGSHRTCFVAEDVLTAKECDEIIRACEAYGWYSLGPGFARDYREYKRIMFLDELAAEALFERLRSCLPSTYTDGSGEEWRLVGLNELFRLSKYEQGGLFGPHRDACLRRSDSERSFLTVIVYLNSVPSAHGGATGILRAASSASKDATLASSSLSASAEADQHESDDDADAATVQPAAGRALVFDHSLLHHGHAVTQDGQHKFLLRTDVCYRRHQFG